MLIADSWFGSVACAKALYKNGIFAVMNVKTAHKGYPKEVLLDELGEIKGNKPADKAKRAERRGKHAGYLQEFTVGARRVNILATGHNKKVPLLLVCTYGSLKAGEMHTKVWQAPQADGTMRTYRRDTPQPEVHALYRKYMNLVDLHNKLRQGVVSMADVWHTVSWPDRHFAEGLGFWEVNVYKALLYFQPATWGERSHNDFRMRLAFAFMTLGKTKYEQPVRSEQLQPSKAKGSAAPPSSVPLPSTQAQAGATIAHEYTQAKPKTCSYCGRQCRLMCETCVRSGQGHFFVCSTGSGRDCISRHVSGELAKHGTTFSKYHRKRSAEESQYCPYVPPSSQHRSNRDSPSSRKRRTAAAREKMRSSSASNSGQGTSSEAARPQGEMQDEEEPTSYGGNFFDRRNESGDEYY